MIPLHVHSNYTFLKGTITVEKLVEQAARYKLQSIALTDTNSMQGIVPFVKAARDKNIKPIIGCLIDDPKNEKDYIITLAKNSKGYSNICKIITSRKLNDDFSIAQLLKEKLENLIIISPSLEILRHISVRENLFVELIASKNEKNNNRKRFELAKEKRIKYVVTNPVYFLNKNDFLLHKAVSAIRLRTTIDNISDENIVDDNFYFKDSLAIKKEWRNLPNAIKNISSIAAECNLDLKLNEYKFPVYSLPLNETADSKLWKEVDKGVKEKYKVITNHIKERLEMELSVISDMGFSNYFLIVWDIVNEAKNRGMMIIGRGSAANSLVAYCLGVTQIDPIEHNLYFERFLNKARTSPPDFDIDFSWKERDEIVKYIFEKYGYENVAMISTTVTFRARSAFREVAKAFGITNEEISKYSKRIPWTDAANLPNLSKLFPEAKDLDFGKEPWKTIVVIASQIARFPRHLSIHPGGIVITPTKVTDFVALEYAKNKGLGLIITQPDMYSIEELGLIKIDILSQRSLGVLRDSMESIKGN
ncbi:MAG: PHP domain-containing protein [Ignavibacteria bacterium]|nr:PHP domain-containing protein [Ignavibacteria bacterium]MBT8381138.1 PHP domain-containing protein [Ignavibacteria bacterium]NNJ54391.1 DNA polymerase III subunit alpha [Ignavibacteriaceae bacterium]NNL21703.1 DNA polymerase III subunit alpha [Ignavibacteriaceae bacterium]